MKVDGSQRNKRQQSAAGSSTAHTPPHNCHMFPTLARQSVSSGSSPSPPAVAMRLASRVKGLGRGTCTSNKTSASPSVARGMKKQSSGGHSHTLEVMTTSPPLLLRTSQTAAQNNAVRALAPGSEVTDECGTGDIAQKQQPAGPMEVFQGVSNEVEEVCGAAHLQMLL